MKKLIWILVFSLYSCTYNINIYTTPELEVAPPIYYTPEEPGLFKFWTPNQDLFNDSISLRKSVQCDKFNFIDSVYKYRDYWFKDTLYNTEGEMIVRKKRFL